MDTNDKRLQYLIGVYLNDTCTAEELQEFWQHIQTLKDDTHVREQLHQLWQTSAGTGRQTPPQGWEKTLQRIYSNAHEWEQEQSVIPMQPVLKRRSWQRIAVAASVLLVISIACYFLFFNQKDKSREIVKIEPTKDVEAPKATKAMLTLTDGSRIPVDSLTSVNQGEVQLVKIAEGKIVYSGSTNEIAYNTLNNPRGSKVIDMTLADGSRVWLNAGSSVTYPVAFIGNERKVAITGEAYFEVSHDAAKPFFVTFSSPEEGGREGTVQVLGTHFNVKAYDDEENIKVTLLEGSVNVSNKNVGGLLKPGQQAQINTDIKIIKDVDMDAVMAWKNELFSFNRANLQTVMKELGRWYDVDVVYENGIPAMEFGGELQRDLNLSQVLKALEKSKVHFRIEGRKIVVMK